MEIVRKVINRKELFSYKLFTHQQPAVSVGSYVNDSTEPYILVVSKTLYRDEIKKDCALYKVQFEIITAPKLPEDMDNKKHCVLAFTAYLEVNDEAEGLLKTLSNMYKKDSKIKVEYRALPTRPTAKLELYDGTNTHRLFLSSDPYEPGIVHKFKVDYVLMPMLDLFAYTNPICFYNVSYARSKLKPYLDLLKQHNIAYSLVQVPVSNQPGTTTMAANSGSVFIICVTDKSKQDKLGELKKYVKDYAEYHPDLVDYRYYFDFVDMGNIYSPSTTFTIYLYAGLNGNNLPIHGIDKFNVTKEYKEQILEILRS